MTAAKGNSVAWKFCERIKMPDNYTDGAIMTIGKVEKNAYFVSQIDRLLGRKELRFHTTIVICANIYASGILKNFLRLKMPMNCH
jgi:hypothetical protein